LTRINRLRCRDADGRGPVGLQVHRADDHADHDGRLTIALRGEACTEHIAAVQPRLEALVADADSVLLDLRDLVFIDGRGLTMLAVLNQDLSQRGGNLEVRNPSPSVRQVLEIVGFGSLVSPTDDAG
jgi:anti-anti-sigma factor